MEKVQSDFVDFKTRKCIGEKSVSCDVNDKTIEEISRFIAHIIPKCDKTDITLDDIKDGKILSKGGFGYSFLTSLSNKNRKKIIKMAICIDEESTKEMKEELDLHKEIVKSKNEVYIKLFGYYIRNKETNQYEYFDYNTDFKEPKCVVNVPENIGCETYTILEAGEGDLYKYINEKRIEHKGVINALKASKKYTVESLLEVTKFYKISEYFLKTKGKIFIHNDLKLENIVYKSDSEFNLIDFGLSELTDNFFNFGNVKGTLFNYEYLYNNPKYMDYINKYSYYIYLRSPMYDMFCVCIALLELFCNQTFDQIGNNSDNFSSKILRVKFIVERYNFSNDIKEFVKYLIDLTMCIYDFHQNNLKELERSNNDIINLRSYLFANNIESLVVPEIYGRKKPVYVKTGNKVKDDYTYFDNIMNYFIFNNFDLFYI